MILIKKDYMVFTIPWKIKGKIVNHSSETKQIECKLKGRIRDSTSLAITCVTDEAQQWKSQTLSSLDKYVRTNLEINHLLF